MKRTMAILFLLSASGWGVAGCGDGASKVQEPPVDGAGEGRLSCRLTLEGPSGGSPVAGDTLVSRTTLVNGGNGTAWTVVLVDSLIPRFDLVETRCRPAARLSLGPAVQMDSLDVAPGDTALLEVILRVPEFFPDGFRAYARARVSYDDDGVPSTPRVGVLSDDPSTPAAGDRTRTTIANEGADFHLLAPGVFGAFLSGQFNGWTPQSPEYALFPDEAGELWGLTIPGLSGEQQYKFVIPRPDGGVEWVGDPRAARVAFDGYGNYNSVWGIALPDPVAGLWGGIDPTRLVIYELFTWDFSPTGDLAGLLEGLTGGLQNLADLGVNAVELLPMTVALGPGFNWGYSPAFYFAVDPDYGTPEQMAEFVQTAHDHGIAVILDMVFNHSAGDSPLAVLDRVGTHGVFLSPTQADVFGMPQLNWFTSEMRQFFLDCTLFWIEQYGIDGFRMDLVDPADYDGYRWWRDEVKLRHPEVFLVGEDFRYPWEPNSVTFVGMDAQWGGQHTSSSGTPANNFQQVVMAILEEDPYLPRWMDAGGVGCFETSCNPMWSLANVLEPTPQYPTHHNEIKYIVSHDERRVVNEVLHHGSADAARVGGVAKAKLGAATLLTAVGIPMIYMGEEIGEDDYVENDPTPNKVDWTDGDPGLRAYYQNLIALRLTHPSLAAGGIDFHCPSWSVSEGPCQVNRTLCYWRYPGTDPGAADVVVASNYDHDAHDFDIPFPSSGTWHLFEPESGTTTPVLVEGGSLGVTLAASTAYLFLADDVAFR